MSQLEPFRAVRYNLDRVELADVIAPPYDVVGPERRAELEARSPYNAIQVELPRDEPGRDRYEAARCRFRDWLDSGVLVTDTQPAYYLYRMGWTDGDGQAQQTSGVLGALGLDPGGADVLPHERTMDRPKDDRLRLLQACQANLSPIWVLSLAHGLGAASEPAGPPIARCTDEGGVHHRLWRIDSPAGLEAVAGIVGSAPVVVADGHHRYETALAHQAAARFASGDQPGPHDFVLAYVVGLDDGHPGVAAIHRLVTGLPDGFSMPDALAPTFDVVPAGPPDPELAAQLVPEGALGLVTQQGAYLLRPRAAPPSGTADAEVLEAALGALAPHTLAFHASAEEVVARVDKGESQAGFLLRPVTVAQIESAARAGRRMPQKSTFFHPKPRTGLVFRTLNRPAEPRGWG